MTDSIDRRLACASDHAAKISAAAKALDLAIHMASRDGYHAKVRVKGPQTPDGSFIGSGYGAEKQVLEIKATIVFDIGEAV